MKKLTMNPSNKKYYSSEYIKGWKDGVNAQYEARPKGEWIDSRDTDTPWNDGFKCSACKSNSLIRYNFCPNCGADMRGKNNEA